MPHAPEQVRDLGGSDDIAGIDRVMVATYTATENVAAVTRRILFSGEAVASSLADEKVLTTSTDQEVDAAAAKEPVLAASPKDSIVASTAEDDVRTLPTED